MFLQFGLGPGGVKAVRFGLFGKNGAAVFKFRWVGEKPEESTRL
jgi:hypothetical protein